MIFKKFFEMKMAATFAGIGRLVGRQPLAVITMCLMINAMLSVGFVWFEETNSVRNEYSPMNSPSRREYAVAEQFLNQNGILDPSYVMVMAKDGGSLLRDTYRNRIIELIKTLEDNVTLEFHGRTFDFRSLCEPYCDINTAFLAFLKLYDPAVPSTHTYPQVDLFGSQAFIGNHVYDVTLKNGTNQMVAFGTSVLAIYLVTSKEDVDVVLIWLNKARETFKEERFEILQCEITGDMLVSAEVRRMGIETAPMISLSITAMIIFVVCSSIRRDPARAKPWESLVGCLIPLLALISTTGLLFWFGWKFQPIIVAAFFLVLSVGVDDVFIILRAWDRTNTDEEVAERMSQTIEDAGPSILISSITNAMAFFIGMTSQTPAVRSFSLYSAIAICICFVYQLLMFSAVLAISGHRERAGRQSCLCWRKANPKARSALVERISAVQGTLIRRYSKILPTWRTRFILAVFMCFYYYACVVGITQLRTLVTIEKMALPDSYLQGFQDAYEASVKTMQHINVFVLNPGDLRDPQRLKRLKQIVLDYENATFAYGPDSTFFWLRAYEEFLNFYSETAEFTYVEMPTFFKTATYFYLTTFVKYNETACLENDPKCVTSFFFMTNFEGHIKYHELIPALNDWRRIAANYSDFDVVPFSEHSPFIDQTLAIESTIWSSMGAALLCTAIACFIFIPNLACIITACLSVFSIALGILGLLSLWGIDLDPLSMAALLMAVGFSVDFTSHIAYHYYKSKQSDPSLRLEETLTCIGWPLVQVGLSTIIAILPLSLKPSYLVMVFLKTIVVVCSLGMFHGLVIMPAILTAISQISRNSSASSVIGSTVVSEHSSTESPVEESSNRKIPNLIRGSINPPDLLKLGGDFKPKKVAPATTPIPEKATIGSPALTHNIILGQTSPKL